ncbi:M24 family metallopeptidase [Halomonas korlensis]|uniref:M24 family metallopeptidase n=1 Tax=Halomonas korlensis TaxID=463301 RepID=UPI000B7DDA5E|nr:M24 family metallopeptidase [Halomonas korlensis]
MPAGSQSARHGRAPCCAREVPGWRQRTRIRLAYLGASRQRETALPYASIVGVNAHGGVLHYQHCDTTLSDTRHSMLIDAGQRYRGYCADITRT